MISIPYVNCVRITAYYEKNIIRKLQFYYKLLQINHSSYHFVRPLPKPKPEPKRKPIRIGEIEAGKQLPIAFNPRNKRES
jgi:hypothetical protein